MPDASTTMFTSPIAEEDSEIQISKSASPATGVRSNTEVTYTLTLRASALLVGTEEAVTGITLNDAFSSSDRNKVDLNTLQITDAGGANCSIDGERNISCTLDTLSGGSQIQIRYTVRTIGDSAIMADDGKTPVSNTVEVRGTFAGGEVSDQSSFSLNSDGSAIALASLELLQGLQRGWWGFYNYHTSYPNLFDTASWQSFGIGPPPCATATPNSACPTTESRSPNAMFWCTWNVIYAFANAGRPIVNPASPGRMTGVSGMRSYFIEQSLSGQGEYIGVRGYGAAPSSPRLPTVSDIRAGDVAFFAKSGDLDAHVAIVGVVTDSYIITYDSNNYRKEITYTVGTNGEIRPNGQVSLNGVARLQ
jgi:hypothetical protein